MALDQIGGELVDEIRDVSKALGTDTKMSWSSISFHTGIRVDSGRQIVPERNTLGGVRGERLRIALDADVTLR